jgi:hypothetical protein
MMTSLKSAKSAMTMTATALILALGFSACNTIGGAGKDVKSVGKAVERTAEDAK